LGDECKAAEVIITCLRNVEEIRKVRCSPKKGVSKSVKGKTGRRDVFFQLLRLIALSNLTCRTRNTVREDGRRGKGIFRKEGCRISR